MTEVDLNTFPSDRYEALALVYLENQDLSSCSPEEVAQRYLQAHNEISYAFRKKAKKDKNGMRQIVL